MAKLTLLIGLPASGKSTFAKELLKNSGNTVRINKDLLRTMLHFDKWSGRNEGLTRVAAKILAKDFLIAGKDVIIDDTNLNTGTVAGWQSLVDSIPSARLEKVVMETTLNECIKRDLLREKNVGKDVIIQMAMANGLMPAPSKPYILCDLDGTLADCSHRLHFVKQTPKDWKSFFAGIEGDSLRNEVRAQVAWKHEQGHPVILLSARPEDYRAATENWLKKQDLGFEYVTLIMRRAGDKRDDAIVKKELLDRYFPDKSLIKCVFDDRPKVIRMWREQGLEVIDVGVGIDF